ncbi:MAG: hypothetical protein ACTHN3_03445 [Solirubrobacterales bacterium]
MNELVHWILHIKSSSSPRLPSFAGKGLSERMRSTGFALLGMTAAAGLALVAIFAQPGFPLLEPAPLPHEPSTRQSIAKAEKLTLDHNRAAFAPTLSRRSKVHAPTSAGGRTRQTGGETTGGDTGSGAGTVVQAPAPSVSAPETIVRGGGSTGGGSGGGAPAPVPAPTPEPSSTAPSTPVSSPKPTSPPPEATVSSSEPEPAPAPGNSSSAAAAEHASERGIEASSSAVTPSASDPAAAEPGNGNGLAKGHEK